MGRWLVFNVVTVNYTNLWFSDLGLEIVYQIFECDLSWGVIKIQELTDQPLSDLFSSDWKWRVWRCHENESGYVQSAEMVGTLTRPRRNLLRFQWQIVQCASSTRMESVPRYKRNNCFTFWTHAHSHSGIFSDIARAKITDEKLWDFVLICLLASVQPREVKLWCISRRFFSFFSVNLKIV